MSRAITSAVSMERTNVSIEATNVSVDSRRVSWLCE